MRTPETDDKLLSELALLLGKHPDGSVMLAFAKPHEEGVEVTTFVFADSLFAVEAMAFDLLSRTGRSLVTTPAQLQEDLPRIIRINQAAACLEAHQKPNGLAAMAAEGRA